MSSEKPTPQTSVARPAYDEDDYKSLQAKLAQKEAKLAQQEEENKQLKRKIQLSPEEKWENESYQASAIRHIERLQETDDYNKCITILNKITDDIKDLIPDENTRLMNSLRGKKWNV